MTALLAMLRPFLVHIAIAIGVVAFAAGVGWEHRGPQTLPLSLAGKSLKVQRDAALTAAAFWKGRAEYWHAAYRDWRAAHVRCETARTKANRAAADGVNAAFAAGGTADSNAFKQGFAAGDRAGLRRGLKTCGAADAPSVPATDRPGPDGPGRVRPDGQAGPDPVFGGDAAYRPGG